LKKGPWQSGKRSRANLQGNTGRTRQGESLILLQKVKTRASGGKKEEKHRSLRKSRKRGIRGKLADVQGAPQRPPPAGWAEKKKKKAAGKEGGGESSHKVGTKETDSGKGTDRANLEGGFKKGDPPFEPGGEEQQGKKKTPCRLRGKRKNGDQRARLEGGKGTTVHKRNRKKEATIRLKGKDDSSRIGIPVSRGPKK